MTLPRSSLTDYADRHGQKWEQHEDEQLATMVKEGGTLESIAHTMGRTAGSILGRMEHLAQIARRFEESKALIMRFHK